MNIEDEIKEVKKLIQKLDEILIEYKEIKREMLQFKKANNITSEIEAALLDDHTIYTKN